MKTAPCLALTEDLCLTYQRRFSPTLSPDFVRTDIIDAIPDVIRTLRGWATSVLQEAGARLLDGALPVDIAVAGQANIPGTAKARLLHERGSRPPLPVRAKLKK